MLVGSTRCLFYLCAFGRDIQDRFEPLPLSDHEREASAGELFASLYAAYARNGTRVVNSCMCGWCLCSELSTQIAPDLEERFLSEDEAEVLAAWRQLSASRVPVTLNVCIEKAEGTVLPRGCLGSPNAMTLQASVMRGKTGIKPSFIVWDGADLHCCGVFCLGVLNRAADDVCPEHLLHLPIRSDLRSHGHVSARHHHARVSLSPLVPRHGER